MLPLLELISAVIGITGAILNVKKNKFGFILWIIGNTLWTIYGFTTKQYFFMIQYIVFASISFWGFMEWNKEEKNKIKI